VIRAKRGKKRAAGPGCQKEAPREEGRKCGESSLKERVPSFGGHAAYISRKTKESSPSCVSPAPVNLRQSPKLSEVERGASEKPLQQDEDDVPRIRRGRATGRHGAEIHEGEKICSRLCGRANKTAGDRTAANGEAMTKSSKETAALLGEDRRRRSRESSASREQQAGQSTWPFQKISAKRLGKVQRRLSQRACSVWDNPGRSARRRTRACENGGKAGFITTQHGELWG